LGAILSCGGRQPEKRKRKRKKEIKEFPSSFLVESGRLLFLPPSPPPPFLGLDEGVSKWVFDISLWLANLVFSPSFPSYRWE
jgi:hypothetical protein